MKFLTKFFQDREDKKLRADIDRLDPLERTILNSALNEPTLWSLRRIDQGPNAGWILAENRSRGVSIFSRELSQARFETLKFSPEFSELWSAWAELLLREREEVVAAAAARESRQRIERAFLP